ncbi:MAG TPA: four helix bundle protein [Gemmatimonadaceae bacterium]|jgi:four helix bundle protein|nr:four helix bundle protein [Gemmatimonadaceae bacterium]
MSAGLRDLKVWQEAVALAADVVRAMRHGSRREVKAVADAAMLSAVALAAQIADGYGRYTAPEQRQSYRAARRELYRLETHLTIARHADLISGAHLAQLTHRAQLVGRLLGGFLVYLDRQLTDPASRDSARAPG